MITVHSSAVQGFRISNQRVRDPLGNQWIDHLSTWGESLFLFQAIETVQTVLKWGTFRAQGCAGGLHTVYLGSEQRLVYLTEH